MSTLSASQSTFSEPRPISLPELQKRFEEAQESKKLELQGFSFDPERFQLLMRFLNSATQLTNIRVTKSYLKPEQTEKILSTSNSNLMKGVKLQDEEGRRFGNAYTDWHEYNMAKQTQCRLNETTKEALCKFEKLPDHVIDFGAGTGQETIALLMMGCPSVTAIDGDKEAMKILASRASEYIHSGSLKIYKGPFLEYISEAKADLFISSFTWPYRPPEDFHTCWQHSLKNLKPGGWIAGHFFGPPKEPDTAMTYHTENAIYTLLQADFDEISIKVKEQGSQPVFGGATAPWGILYDVVAKKKTNS